MENSGADGAVARDVAVGQGSLLVPATLTAPGFASAGGVLRACNDIPRGVTSVLRQ